MDVLCSLFVRLVLLVFSHLWIVRTQQFGDLRLVNGPTPNAGRVEMYLGLRGWFTSCDANWDIEDAIVVCRQLGFPGAALARARSPYGGVVGIPLARDWQCHGDEKRLDGCTYTVKQRCSDAVGVICQGPGYLGCYADFSGHFHSVLRDSYVATDLMTVSACREHCKSTNSHLAGLKNGQECYCGKLSQMLPPRNKMSDGQCQVPCPGNPDEVCGGGASALRSTGPDRLAVFDLTIGRCKPTEMKNGRALSDKYSYNDVTSFECNEGYHMINASAIRCVMLPDGTGNHVTWNASFPSCQAEVIDTRPMMAQEEHYAGYDTHDRQYILVAVIFSLLVVLMSAIIFMVARRKISARQSERQRISTIRNDPPPSYTDLVWDYEPIAAPRTSSFPNRSVQDENKYQSLDLPDRPPASRYSVRVNVPGHPSYPENLWKQHAGKW